TRVLRAHRAARGAGLGVVHLDREPEMFQRALGVAPVLADDAGQLDTLHQQRRLRAAVGPVAAVRRLPGDLAGLGLLVTGVPDLADLQAAVGELLARVALLVADDLGHLAPVLVLVVLVRSVAGVGGRAGGRLVGHLLGGAGVGRRRGGARA